MSENNQETNENVEEVTSTVTKNEAEESGVGKGIPIGAFAVMLVFVLMVGLAVGYVIASNKSGDTKKTDKTETASKKEEKEVTKDPLECVELGEYKGLQVSVEPTEEDLKYAIEDALDENSTDEELEGVVAEGDTIYCSFEATVDGKPYEDGTGEDYVEIGSGDWVEGFESGLVGVKTGETKTLNLKFPEDYDETVGGKDVTFVVNVKYILGETIVPEYNEEFVKSVSDCKTIEEYEKQLKEEIRQENEDCKAELAWEQVVANANITAYPTALVEQSKSVVAKGYEDMAEMYGMTLDEIMAEWGVSEEDFDEMANEEVADIMIAMAIADKEKIEVTDEEYQSYLEEEYSYYDTYDSIEAFEKEMGEYIKNMSLVSKVTDWVGESAVIAD